MCILCKLNINPDYKNVRLLSQFQSRHTGRIYEKHITGLCESKQKKVEQEIYKAQQCGNNIFSCFNVILNIFYSNLWYLIVFNYFFVLGLMGYMTKDPKFVNDPMLFDPNFPFKPHKY